MTAVDSFEVSLELAASLERALAGQTIAYNADGLQAVSKALDEVLAEHQIEPEDVGAVNLVDGQFVFEMPRATVTRTEIVRPPDMRDAEWSALCEALGAEVSE